MTDDVWESYGKSIKRIPRRKNAAPASPRVRHLPKPQKKVAEPTVRYEDFVSTPLVLPASLERSKEKKLRQGELEIEARIDLHGLTQKQAFERLAHFVAAQVRNGARTLLIITGKGSKGEGVLRASLPDWLGALPESRHILALRPAAPNHGGNGAFYLLLKRRKMRQE